MNWLKCEKLQHFYSSSLNKDDTKNDSFHVSVSARSQVQPVGVLFLLDEQVSTHFQLLADKRLQRRHPTHAVCVRVSSPARVIKAAKLWNCRHILVMKSSASSSVCSPLHWQCSAQCPTALRCGVGVGFTDCKGARKKSTSVHSVHNKKFVMMMWYVIPLVVCVFEVF